MRTALTALVLLVFAAPPVLAEEREDALQLNEEGIRLVAAGKFEEAIKTFTKARRLQPADVTLKQNLATARSRHAGA
ncbi:MAG: hypothetical protein ABFS86_18375, partial [Planctomycetota bacterium]